MRQEFKFLLDLARIWKRVPTPTSLLFSSGLYLFSVVSQDGLAAMFDSWSSYCKSEGLEALAAILYGISKYYSGNMELSLAIGLIVFLVSAILVVILARKENQTEITRSNSKKSVSRGESEVVTNFQMLDSKSSVVGNQKVGRKESTGQELEVALIKAENHEYNYSVEIQGEPHSIKISSTWTKNSVHVDDVLVLKKSNYFRYTPEYEQKLQIGKKIYTLVIRIEFNIWLAIIENIDFKIIDDGKKKKN